MLRTGPARTSRGHAGTHTGLGHHGLAGAYGSTINRLSGNRRAGRLGNAGARCGRLLRHHRSARGAEFGDQIGTRRHHGARGGLSGELFRKQWLDAGVPADQIEGLTLPDARTIKEAVTVPVICTGGFQTASVIRAAIDRGDCDAVSIARPLVANNDLVNQFAAGHDQADKPCTYCNKCLVHVVEHPIGCYEESRFASREEMLAQVMSVFHPPAFS